MWLIRAWTPSFAEAARLGLEALVLLDGLSYAPGPSTLTSVVERFAPRGRYRLAELRGRRVGTAGGLDG